MPPKRAAAAKAGPAKKAKSSESSESMSAGASASASATSEPEAPAAPAAPPRNKRWAKVSGSANVDANYLHLVQNPLEAYKYVCLCQPPFSTGDDDSDEEDEEEEEEEDEAVDVRSRKPCDGGDKCLCEKLASEHPDHPWKLTFAAKHKFSCQRIHCDIRCPDSFSMADDGDIINETFQLIGRLFLSMLTRLAKDNLLSPSSEVQNAGLIMALFIQLTRDLREYGILDDSNKESLGPAKDKKKWYPHTLNEQILMWAKKYDIKLVRPSNINSLISQTEGEGEGDRRSYC
ncbi:hypothetical protein QBC46DRAFT_364798 [Diplogelasinospora grovesii]|uniref:Uncharacterized protein n=1 Tax=Diplogelasinospora grovesii TaxID=303347 RepID=A0AAN6S4C1_9PEZI|nr:hypothetical protein QBC46DRAFT_364798 [Diplogelasinospora grovesii]